MPKGQRRANWSSNLLDRTLHQRLSRDDGKNWASRIRKERIRRRPDSSHVNLQVVIAAASAVTTLGLGNLVSSVINPLKWSIESMTWPLSTLAVISLSGVQKH